MSSARNGAVRFCALFYYVPKRLRLIKIKSTWLVARKYKHLVYSRRSPHQGGRHRQSGVYFWALSLARSNARCKCVHLQCTDEEYNVGIVTARFPNHNRLALVNACSCTLACAYKQFAHAHVAHSQTDRPNDVYMFELLTPPLVNCATTTDI